TYPLGIGRAGQDWVLSRLAVYLLAAAVSAVAFFVAISAYVFFFAPQRVSLPDIPLQEMILPPPAINTPRSVAPGDLVAGSQPGAVQAFALSAMLGVKIFGANNEPIGKVSEIVMAKEGNAEAVVVALEGSYWMNTKYVAVPYKSVQWVTIGAAGQIGEPERGLVGYSKADLQKVPVRGHPMIIPRTH
ncbi:MAG TPA: PRC-barrel domain-containing protein, partial [Bradyrhizobium sp.]|nr:PRC-barrel domain-containing protein [Bradyrhizobium sp.]